MISEEDCPCTDVSGSLNVAPLHTEMSSIINSSDSYVELNSEEKNPVKETHRSTKI